MGIKQMEIAGCGVSLNNADGVSFDIFFQGCSLGCDGCQNPELQDFVPGQYKEEDVIEMVKENLLLLDYICLLGGEPLDQDLGSLRALINEIKSLTNVRVILWTGYTLKELYESREKLIICNIVDEVRYGRYDSADPEKKKRRTKFCSEDLI